MNPHVLRLLIGAILINVQPSLCTNVRDPPTLPAPTGPYRISSLALPFTDLTRNDTGAQSFFNVTIPRSVMTSIYYPISRAGAHDNNNETCACSSSCNEESSPYLPPATSAFLSSRFQIPRIADLRLPFPSQGDSNSNERHGRTTTGNGPAKSRPQETFPLVIFSPAFATSRLLYASLLADLASHGYVVAAIDHPYDTDMVEFPGPSGEVVYSPFLNVSDPDVLLGFASTAQEVRAADISFVLSTLLAASPAHSHSHSHIPISADKNITLLGHSLGGAASLLALHDDPRVSAAVNLDGFLFGPAENNYLPAFGSEKPFLLFSSQEGGGNAESWDVFWALSSEDQGQVQVQEKKNSKKWIEWTRAQHFDFSDLPSVLDLLGVDDFPTQQLRDLYPLENGVTADRKRAVVKEYVLAFLDAVAYGRDGGLLDDGQSEAFPEVRIVR